MDEIASKSERAANAYRRGNFRLAMDLMNEVVDADPHSVHGFGSRILRASAHESGRAPAGKSLDLAMSDYEFLADSFHEVGSVGIVGIARVLSQLDIQSNAENIIDLCVKAEEVDGAPEADLVVGDVWALAYHDEEKARSHYERAVKSGEKQGLIKIAMSFEREGKKIRSASYALRYLLIAVQRRFAATVRSALSRRRDDL